MNEEFKVLLICGAGMSSGIISKNAKNYAKKNDINMTFEARSNSEVASFLSSISLLMIGPHYESSLEKFKTIAEPFGVPVVVIPKKTYARLDGEGIVKLAKETLKN